MASVYQLLQQALKLPEDERAQMAAELLRSLDAGQDLDVAEAWNEELARRVADTEQSRVQTVPWSTVRQRMLKREEDAAT